MICKTCGMDSKTAGTCSWCGASLASPGETAAEPKPERIRPVIREEAEPEAPETEVAIGTVPSLNSLLTEPRPAALPPASASAPSLHPSESGTSHPKITVARKMAPPTPPPGGKLRTPAPAAPPPSSRSGSSATGKLPTLSSLPNAPAPAPPAPARTTSSLQDQADAMFTPTDAHSAVSPALSSPLGSFSTPSASVTGASAAPAAVTALADAPFMAPAPPSIGSAAPLPSPNKLDTAIGSGVTPSKLDAPAASAKPRITEQQKRAAVEAAMAESMHSPMELLTRYLGVFAVILVVTGLLAHLLPRFYLIPMIVAMFVAAMLLPIMRVTPWVEEDSEDLIWFVVLTLVFGPLVALIIYGFVAGFRQSFNASIMGGMAVVALLRIVAEMGAGNVSGIGQLFAMTSPFAGLQHVDSGIIKLLLRNWTGFAALAGWYAASTFHKEDE